MIIRSIVRSASLIFVFASQILLAQGPTYSKEVSRIMQAKCQLCHRTGDIAPFALNSYDDAVNWSADIQRVLNDNLMPPWKPLAGFGEFRDSYALTDDEKQTILSWIANGTPQGDPADMPDALPDIGPWPLGTPDVVLQVPQPFTPPRGKDVYRCYVMPETGFGDSTYLSAIDVLPGNRQIVHHVLVFQDTTGTAAQMDGQDGNPGYSCFGGPGIPADPSSIFSILNSLSGIAGWAPGQRTHFLPDGVGIQIKPKARIVIQVHYYPVGKTGPDQTSVGLYVSTTPVQKNLYMIPVVNTTFSVPPGKVLDVNAQFPALLSGKALLIYPHMHLLGRKIKVDLVETSGKKTPLIYEDNWDFNWQGAYTFAEPVKVPLFSNFKLTCTFDNTQDNPRNPNNPLVAVSWGERTTDEMCLAFVGITLDFDPATALNQMKLKR